jgi:hypothetical protein
MVLHSTFFTPALWWEEVCTHASFEISQIFTVVSIDPEARTEGLAQFKDKLVTESV